MGSDEEVDYDESGVLDAAQRRRERSLAWSVLGAPRETDSAEVTRVEVDTPEVEIKVETMSSDEEDDDDYYHYDRPHTPPLPFGAQRPPTPESDRRPTPPLPTLPLISRVSPLTPTAIPFAPGPVAPRNITRTYSMPLTPDMSDTSPTLSSSSSYEIHASAYPSPSPATPPKDLRAEVTRMIDRLHARDAAEARKKARTAGPAGASGVGQRRAYLSTHSASTTYPPPHLAPDDHLAPLGLSNDPQAQAPLRIRVEPSLLQFASASATAGPSVLSDTSNPSHNNTSGSLPGPGTSQSTAPAPSPLEVQLAVISSATLSSMQYELDTARQTARHERAEREKVVTILHKLCNEEHVGDMTYAKMDRIRAFAKAELVSMGMLQV